jgi:AcrR family transcriptional regulator
MSSDTRAEPGGSRDVILAAALEILRKDGHAALTVRRVAERAGCSTIGVYTWFGGKDGLVDAILVDGYRSFALALRRSKPIPGPLGGLVGQARAYRTWAMKHPTSYRVMFMQAVPGHSPGVEAAAEGLVAYETLLREVQREQLSGSIAESDADGVALTVWGLVHGLVSIELASAEPPVTNRGRNLHRRSYDLALRLMVRGLSTSSEKLETPQTKKVGRQSAPPLFV